MGDIVLRKKLGWVRVGRQRRERPRPNSTRQRHHQNTGLIVWAGRWRMAAAVELH